jgi:hypothetical protein
MIRRSSLLLVLALSACRSSGPDARGSEAPDRAKRDRASADVEQPERLTLPWGTALYAAPQEGALALHLGSAESSTAPRPTVQVIGRSGSFWKIETADAIAGLDFYALQLYVPIGVGDPVRAIPPGPDTAVEPEPEPPAELDARSLAIQQASESGIIGLLNSSYGNPPLQSGERRPAELATDFRLKPSTQVYWPDGSLAGEVRSEHAFVGPGEARTSGPLELRCFAVRVGPDAGGQGELCFAATTVQEVAVVPEPESPFGEAFAEDEAWGTMWGDEIGDSYDYGGLGLTGEGVSAGGAYTGEGYGDIGTIGQGGGGWGYGSGSTGLSLQPDADNVRATGSMDPDIGRRIIQAHTSEIHECWTAAGASSGSVDITLGVDADGNVTSSKATTSDEFIRDCIEQAAMAWKFPKSIPGSITVPMIVEAWP